MLTVTVILNKSGQTVQCRVCVHRPMCCAALKNVNPSPPNPYISEMAFSCRFQKVYTQGNTVKSCEVLAIACDCCTDRAQGPGSTAHEGEGGIGVAAKFLMFANEQWCPRTIQVAGVM